MYIHETKCPDCRQYIEASFTVGSDGVVRCLDCGKRATGQIFRESIARSRQELAAYGPLPRWRDDCNKEYIP
jgi:tRNA(Ile2) C34 agmatinyltransferase TiaS